MAGRGKPLAWIAATFVAGIANASTFDRDEVDRVVKFWNEGSRYRIDLPTDCARKGVWQVRLTVEGSRWLWNYNRARGLGKSNPSIPPPAMTAQQSEWEKWIDGKVARDRHLAGEECAILNGRVLPSFAMPGSSVVADPGPPPPGLTALAGEPPAFAEAVVPLRHVVRFDDRELAYVDNVEMRPRYAYYRHETGVMSGGQKVRSLSKEHMDSLCEAAGIDASGRRILGAVSMLEGGFDSVNTYDTGFVSVGLIQFASLQAGSGSLGRVLRRMKRDEPKSFDRDFRRFGIDVDDSSRLVAVDLENGESVSGADANLRIIQDRRLIAVFQRAGLVSEAFRVSQLKSAYFEYFPGNDEISFQTGGKTVKLRVGDVFRSEAGLATLMDRKVNTGTLDPLSFIVSLVSNETGKTTAEELAPYERDLVTALRYRADYLADSSLSQPGAAKFPNRDFRAASRKSSGRSGRGGSTTGGSSGGTRGG